MKNCAIAFFYYRAKSLAAEGIQYSSGIAVHSDKSGIETDVFSCLRVEVPLIKKIIEQSDWSETLNPESRSKLNRPIASDRKYVSKVNNKIDSNSYDLDLLCNLIRRRKINLNIADDNGRYPLQVAYKKRDFQLINKLLKLGAKPEQLPPQDSEPELILYCAAVGNNVTLARSQLKKIAGSDKHQYDKVTFTEALHYALNNRFNEIVDSMLEQPEVHLNALNSNNDFLLYTAFNRNRDVFKKLVQESRVDLNATNKNGVTIIHYFLAKDEEQFKAVQFLIEHGACINTDSRFGSPLSEALLYDNIKLAKYFIDKGADPDNKEGNGYFPVQLACKQTGGEDMHSLVDMLLQRTSAPDASDPVQLLSFAAIGGNTEVVKLLLAKAGTIDQDELDKILGIAIKNRKATAYSRSSQHNHAAVVEMLLDRGADPNVLDDMGWSWAHLLYENFRAFSWGSDRIFRALIENRAFNPNAFSGISDRTLLSEAVIKGDYETAELLIKNSANADTFYVNKTILSCVVDRGLNCCNISEFRRKLKLVKLLVEDGKADPNKADKDGRYPLQHVIASDGNQSLRAQLANVLLSANADRRLLSSEEARTLDDLISSERPF